MASVRRPSKAQAAPKPQASSKSQAAPSKPQAAPSKVQAAPSKLQAAPSKARPGRNEPCHCGSGRKYKHCCLEKDDLQAAADRAKTAEPAAAQPPDAATPSPAKTPKPQTHQPWKATTSRGFVPRNRTPRK